MKWLQVALKKMSGLIVDDGVFALLILLWLILAWLFPKQELPSALACVVFFAGLAALLLESTLRRVKKP